MGLMSALNHLVERSPAHLQALAAPAGPAPVLGGVAALTRITVLLTDYPCLDVVPAHIVYGAFTGIEDQGQSHGFDSTERNYNIRDLAAHC